MRRHGLLNQPPRRRASVGGSAVKPTLVQGHFGLASGNGISVTSGAAGVKTGVPVSLGVTTAAIDRLQLRIFSASGSSLRIDIYLNGVLRWANLPASIATNFVTFVELPQRIEAGVNVTVAIAATGSATSAVFSVVGVQSSVVETIAQWNPVSLVGASGTNPALDGVSLNLVTNAWFEVGTLPATAQAVFAAIAPGGDTDRRTGRGYIELATGPAGPANLLPTLLTSSSTTNTNPLSGGLIERSFPVGTKFHARAFSFAAPIEPDSINLQLHYGS